MVLIDHRLIESHGSLRWHIIGENLQTRHQACRGGKHNTNAQLSLSVCPSSVACHLVVCVFGRNPDRKPKVKKPPSVCSINRSIRRGILPVAYSRFSEQNGQI